MSFPNSFGLRKTETVCHKLATVKLVLQIFGSIDQKQDNVTNRQASVIAILDLQNTYLKCISHLLSALLNSDT